MKTKLIIFGLLCFKLSFGQNQSVLGVQPFINTVAPIAPNEIFRFQPGNVTQLDAGTGFGFGPSNRWFSIGKVVTGSNTAYGLRFQAGEKAVTFGYQSVNDINPRIQWINSGASLGNLEFRVANSFTSTTSQLVTTMTRDLRTIFSRNLIAANDPLLPKSKVLIESEQSIPTGLRVVSSGNLGIGVGIDILQNSGFNSNTGVEINVDDNPSQGPTFINKGIDVLAKGSSDIVVGVRSRTEGSAFFQAAIEGTTTNNSGNQFAGYFNGDVASIGGTFQGSDAKLKDNIKQETSVLEKLAKLKPVSYDYKKMADLNLPKGLQHGFIAQELATVFPELTKDIKKPVYDKDYKQTSTLEFKSVNYNGLISVLTAGINELNQELQLLKQEIAILKDTKSTLKTANGLIENNKSTFMEQNIPNPFADQTTIRYQLPESTTTAEIMVFDLNGRLIKNYPVNNNQSELTIKATEIGSGLFIYSLVQNGQELLTKKMIVK